MLSFFRHCPVCKVSFQKINWLCLSCQNRLFSSIRLRERLCHGHIRHQYLILWEPEDIFMNQIVYSLKGGGLPSAYKSFAQIFLGSSQAEFHKIFYPSKGQKDHAFALAQQVALESGRPQRELLRVKGKKQAGLTRQQRAQLQFQRVREEVHRALFVDDIVTTGATVKAGYESLGRPRNMTVWSLFYRKSL